MFQHLPPPRVSVDRRPPQRIMPGTLPLDSKGLVVGPPVIHQPGRNCYPPREPSRAIRSEGKKTGSYPAARWGNRVLRITGPMFFPFMYEFMSWFAPWFHRNACNFQLEFALAVLEGTKHILLQAGCGMGKTLGFWIPLLIRTSGFMVVVTLQSFKTRKVFLLGKNPHAVETPTCTDVKEIHDEDDKLKLTSRSSLNTPP